MRYTEFIKTLAKPNVSETFRSYGHKINLMTDGTIFVNDELTSFKNLEEARSYIKTKVDLDKIEQEITEEIYESISENNIAKIIKEYHDVKVTDTLIESYIELASSNLFSVDPVVYQIRKMNYADRVVENRIHYKLDDNSLVVIRESTQLQLNNLLQDQKDIIEYMRKNKENFLHVLDKLEDHHGIN